MKQLIKQFLKFGIVGILSFLMDYGVMIYLTEFINIYYLVSSTISFSVSLIFNYVCSMSFVFKRKHGIGKRKEFIIFAALSIAGLIINQIVMWIMVEKIYIYYGISKLIASGIVMIWNFVTRKWYLENNQSF